MKQFGRKEEATSPVIGVILMVAITVIVAAIIAVFMFGIGAPEKAPQASIKIADVDTATDLITLEHFGGDTLRLGDVKLIIEQDDGTTISRAIYEKLGLTSEKILPGDKLVISTSSGTTTVPSLNGVGTTVTMTDDFSGGVDIVTGATLSVTTLDTRSDQIITKITVYT